MSYEGLELPLIVGMNDVAEAGYPDVLCPVIFVPSCNFRCPYCLNASIAGISLFDNCENRTTLSIDEVISHIDQKNEKQILISGGEPFNTLHIRDLIEILKKHRLSVRIATNGSCFDKMEDFVNSRLIDFVALDLKANPLDGVSYERKIFHNASRRGETEMICSLLCSLRFLNKLVEYPIKGFSHEVRTTLYPPIVNVETISTLSHLLHPNTTWVLQQFRKRTNLFSKEAENVEPYDDATLDELLYVARKRVSNTNLRWP